jgi:TolA-binding protein
MTKKTFLFCVFLFFLGSSFSLVESNAKSVSEEDQLIQVGIGAFKDGFYDIAEKQFSSFIKLYSKHDRIYDIYYLLGRTLTLKRKFIEDRGIFYKILNEGKSFENMDSVLLGIAELEIRLGNDEEAARRLLSLIRSFPKFEETDYAHYLLGLLQLKSNQYGAAETSLQKVSQLSKNNELIRSSCFWLGLLSYRQKQFETAAGYFQDLCGTPTAAPPGYLKYALFWLGESQFKLGRLQESKQVYKTIYERFKNDPLAMEALWKVGFCDYQLGNFKESMDRFQLFKTQFKDSPLLLSAHYFLGKMFLMIGDYPSSIKELNLILNASQGNSWGGLSLLALYWNYIQLGDLEGTQRIYQRLQKLNLFEDEKTVMEWLNAEMLFAGGDIAESLPYYFNILNTRFREKALFQIGKGYFFENKLREAVTNLDILLLEFPNSPYLEEGLFIKGESLAQLKDWDRALEAYAHLLRQNKNNVWHLFALTQMGGIYLFRNEPDKSEKAFKEVMEKFPNAPLFYYAALQLGNLYFNRKDIVEAIQYYSVVLKGNILDLLGEAYFGLGEIFYQQGKFEKALTSFETAIRYFKETSPWFFLTHLEIGNVKRSEGKYEEAKKSYTVILDQSKDEEMKKAAREFMNRMESH